MISIKKLPKPQILVENADIWTREYLAEINANKIPNKEIVTRYKHPDIKIQLERETQGKCAYCESKLKHISFGDIEHILPKNKDARPDLYVEWNNLTLACEQCNRSGKRTYYDENLPLINPYNDIIEEHFKEFGPLIYPMPNDERADITKEVLQLNRIDLVDRRQERIQQIDSLLKLWANTQNHILKEKLEHQLHLEYTKDKEYSSTVKAFLSAMCFPVKA